jgi:hypothetical protein
VGGAVPSPCTRFFGHLGTLSTRAKPAGSGGFLSLINEFYVSIVLCFNVRSGRTGGAGGKAVAAGPRDSVCVDPPPPLRTNRTRRVPHPILIGHAASLTLSMAEKGGCGM